MASYTRSRVRDAQTPLRVYTAPIVNWGSARVYSGRHDDLTPVTSSNEIPHRVVFAGTWRAPWQRWSSEAAFYYLAEAGRPFTYVAGGAGRRGDLNADGSNVNDPVYVPSDARDPREIRFSGHGDVPGADNSDHAQADRIAAQASAFNTFIQAPILLEHVGHTAPPDGVPVFRFQPTRTRWTILPTESAFQLQAGLRYRFGAAADHAMARGE